MSSNIKVNLFTYSIIIILYLINLSPVASGEVNSLINNSMKRNIIIIDPGHGGHDNGIKGTHGFYEKSIALTISRLISKELKNDFSVILTRTDDYFLDLSQRVAKANNNSGDLFISIHTGGSFNKKSKGINIFYH